MWRTLAGTSSSNVFVIGHGEQPCETCQSTLGILRYDGNVLTSQLSDFGRSLDIWAASSGAAFALAEGSSPSPFLRVAVPDPFELGGQVAPRVPPSAEPGLVPVTVNPQRPK